MKRTLQTSYSDLVTSLFAPVIQIAPQCCLVITLDFPGSLTSPYFPFSLLQPLLLPHTDICSADSLISHFNEKTEKLENISNRLTLPSLPTPADIWTDTLLSSLLLMMCSI